MENEPLIDEPLKHRAFCALLGRGPPLSQSRAISRQCWRWRPTIGRRCDDPEAVEAAIWFHDAIYDSKAKDNEAQSAALAEKKLAGRADPDRLRRILAMIIATATHELPRFDDAHSIRDAALFLDMDLSILGAAPDASTPMNGRSAANMAGSRNRCGAPAAARCWTISSPAGISSTPRNSASGSRRRRGSTWRGRSRRLGKIQTGPSPERSPSAGHTASVSAGHIGKRRSLKADFRHKTPARAA